MRICKPESIFMVLSIYHSSNPKLFDIPLSNSPTTFLMLWVYSRQTSLQWRQQEAKQNFLAILLSHVIGTSKKLK